MKDPRAKTPVWFLVLVIVLALPVFQTPALISASVSSAPMVGLLVKIYPAYLVVSAYLAYVCYPTSRLTAWILAGLMVLTSLAIWLLVTAEITPQ